MKTGDIATIAAALFGAIAPIIVALIEKQKPPKPNSKKPKLWLWGVTFAVVGGLVGYILGTQLNSPIPTTVTVANTLTPCSFHSKPSIRRAFPPSNLTGSITSPAHCDLGIISGRQSPITAEGTTQKIPNGSYLWLFVYAPDGKYYPQCNKLAGTEAECTISGDFSDEWTMRTYLADECKPYYLVLVSTNKNATNFLLNTMKTSVSSGSYGLTRAQLKPYDIKELDRVQVETGPCATQTSTP